MTALELTATSPAAWRPARWVIPFFAAAALALVPWVVLLATRLPATHAARHWDVTWVGFDVGLSLVLVAVAAAAWRRSPWLEGVATAAGALLLADAWFDVTTAGSTSDLVVSLVEAAFVEVPIAALCLLLARDARRLVAGAARGR